MGEIIAKDARTAKREMSVIRGWAKKRWQAVRNDLLQVILVY